MDVLADLFKAWTNHVRTPFIGFISLSFIANNWQPIWYLLFADQPVKEKFLYFDANTSFGIPILMGAILAVIYPWVGVFGVFISQFPSRYNARIQTAAMRARRADPAIMKGDELKSYQNRKNRIESKSRTTSNDDK